MFVKSFGGFVSVNVDELIMREEALGESRWSYRRCSSPFESTLERVVRLRLGSQIKFAKSKRYAPPGEGGVW
jgi:hypothetical protein